MCMNPMQCLYVKGKAGKAPNWRKGVTATITLNVKSLGLELTNSSTTGETSTQVVEKEEIDEVALDGKEGESRTSLRITMTSGGVSGSQPVLWISNLETGNLYAMFSAISFLKFDNLPDNNFVTAKLQEFQTMIQNDDVFRTEVHEPPPIPADPTASYVPTPTPNRNPARPA